MRGLLVDRRLGPPATVREHVRGAGESLVLPRGDLRRKHIKALRRFGERAITLHGGEGDLGLEGGDMIPTGTFRDQELLGKGRTCRPGSPPVHSSHLFRKPGPLLLLLRRAARNLTPTAGTRPRRWQQALIRRRRRAIHFACDLFLFAVGRMRS